MQNRSSSCHYCPLHTMAIHLQARALRRAWLIAVFLAAVTLIFTNCNSPLGFGKPIDWEPPELTLDPIPNPLYVRNGTKLTGTVRDNVAVDRVVLTNGGTGEELLKATIDGERWEIELVFTEEQNGEKIMAQISAYDTAGNCGANSIAFITLIIDIRPPIIEYISIQRTNTRIAFLEPLAKLKELEITDPRGEKKDNLYKYQNGWFHVNGIVSDEETKIEVVALNIYDTREINTVLLSIPCDEGYTAYFPRWTVKEDDIIAAGVEKWGQDYKTNYYVNGERYYYRIVIEATDSSENTSVNIEEDEGYICMWARSDDPKGILDPGTRTVVPRGTPLPIDFFDDDSLEWAYAGLLTENQWHGMNDIYPGTRIPAGTDDQKLDWLRGKLLNGDTIYNWRYEKHAGKSDEIEPITEQINGKNLDEKLVYVQTGDQESDYGEYVLFTLASDRKLPPHDGTGPERTNQNIWAGKVWRISLVDENIPLIVFDTKNGCPEENTFPPLANGQSFEIIGYTMRENASGDNKVTTFRMAWIPFEMDGGADSYISDVRKALSANNYPSSIDNDTALNGIQHWEFVETNPLPPGYGLFGPNTNDDVTIPGSVYYQQEFRKTFNILGGKDDIKNVYNNFTYKGKLENETKLFVFYAMDNRGHEVFRQLRLLGMKTPPNLVVYDITNKLGNALLPGLPDPNNSLYINNATGGLNQAYYTALNSYNNTVYSQLKGAASGLTEGDKTIPFQVYPRETKLKYWIKAAENGEIAVDSISMKDISFTGDAQTVGSGYKDADEAYSFCEYYPDVTQRTFLFEAIDKLGNKVQIQRTIAITNAARLVNITTLEENGTYGIGKKINLKANFSSQIYVEGGTPSLNVRYHMKNGSWVYTQLPCSNTPSNGSPTLALEFNFDVPEGSDNRLETMFETIGILPPSQEKRPIVLNSATKIMDYFRMDAAFIPGYANESVIMPNWTTAANSLQEKKEITLDGIRPTITGVSIGGKTAYTDNNYYFKEGETIEVALSADKPIRASDTPVPRLQYFIRDSGGTDRGPYNTAFTYSRPNGSSALVFSLPVNGANCPYDGELRNVSLVLGTGTIMDNVDNEVNAAAIPVPTSRIFIKKTLPPAPVATLNGTPFGTAAANFTVNVVLAIPLPPTASDYPGVTWNDNKRQYSTNGGLAWLDYSAPVTINRDGAYDIRARYVDRAGNDGLESSKAIQIKLSFPNLIAASAAQPNGWYTAGSNLTFNLSFDDTVSVITASNVSITLKDAVTGALHTVNADAAQTNVTTVKFSWTGITGVEMPNGLYISDVNFGGLRDSIDRYGGTGTGTCSAASASNIITFNSNTCPNLPYGGIKVDTIAPSVTTWRPGNGASSAANQSVTQIVLTFREPVMKGSGIITVRPRENFAIPPVFEDTGYYLGTDGTTRYSSSGANRTYIPSFYDIYTNNALNAIERGYLTKGSSMSNLDTHARTGQSYGPYKKMTHGLVEGRGYTGNYNNTNPGANGPNPGLGNVASIPTPTATPTMSMIPDTATKWVLDYQYSITENIPVVNNIRAVLSKIEFRWQKIDVVSTSISGAVVTINLNEPLLKGLEWDVYYPAGTFTDLAGNPAPASGYNAAGAMQDNNTDYWFTSSGAQAPVIRVNRRSYDARNSGWSLAGNRNNNPLPPNYRDDHYGTPPPDTAGWQNANATITDDPATGAGNGWGIGDFNYVHYRVESESKNAAITTKTFQGTGLSRAEGAWTGNVSAANPGVTIVNNMAWTAAPTAAAGTWVLSNIIRRSSNTPDTGFDMGGWTDHRPNPGPTYTVITKNGIPELRRTQGYFGVFRSYNKDFTKAELNPAGGLQVTLSGNQGMLTFGKLEASKSYVVATATLGGEGATGYEGVFRTVIALNHSAGRFATWEIPANTAGRRDRYVLVEGSTAPSATPPIAGFPVRDAEESQPGGLVKAFYNDTVGQLLPRTQFYWVSTEIVCEWLFLQFGGGSWHQKDGETANYCTAGYGDLTYGYNIRTSGDTYYTGDGVVIP